MYGPQEAMLPSSLPHVPLCSCARVGCDHVNRANRITFPTGALFALAQEVVNFDVLEAQSPAGRSQALLPVRVGRGLEHTLGSLCTHTLSGSLREHGRVRLGPEPATGHSIEGRGLSTTLHTGDGSAVRVRLGPECSWGGHLVGCWVSGALEGQCLPGALCSPRAPGFKVLVLLIPT